MNTSDPNLPNGLAAKVAAAASDFPPSLHPQDRLSRLIQRGRNHPRFGPDRRTSQHAVEGCSAPLWIHAECREGRCHFAADSDSAIVKGVAAWLCEFYSGLTPLEVAAAAEVDPLQLSGIDRLLAPTRRDGLSRLRERIRQEANRLAAASAACPGS
jgi:cysteine desulfuration protein SufE